MSRQAKVLLGIGAIVAAVVGGALFMVLSDPTPRAGETAEQAAPPDAAEASDAPEKAASGGRRHARVPGAATLFGIVKHASSEEPAAAQAVRVVGEAIGAIEVTTDSSGAFRFESLPPGGPYAVEVDSEGFAPIRLPGIALDRAEERDLGTLLLDLAVSVEVHVSTMAGEPLPEAAVSAYAAPTFGWGFDWSKAMAQMGQAPVAVATTKTGADGIVVFDELAAGSWTFVARKDGYAQSGKASLRLRSSEEPDPVELHLETGHRLTGRVLDQTGEPIADALVMAGGDGNLWNLGANALRIRATSGDDGAYELTSLRAGDTALWAAPAGATPAQIVTLRIPDVSAFDIRLRAGGILTGRVTLKESGEPVAGAKVRGMSWGTSGGRTSEAVTDEEGRYTIDDLPEGNVGNVTAEKDGLVAVTDGAQQFTPTPFRSGDKVERDIELTPGAALSGTVTGPAGPVAGARVMVMFQRAAGNFDQKQGTTDAEGHYRFDALVEGTYIVQAGAPGLYTPDFPQNWWMALQNGKLPDHLSGKAVAGEEVVTDIELRAGTTVSGRVETSDGEPVAGASVSASSNGGILGGSPEPGISADDGSFAVGGVVPAPQVQLSATRKGLVVVMQDPIAIPDGEPVEGQVLVMQALPVVKGRVTTSTGELPDDAYVQVVALPDVTNGQPVFNPSVFGANTERVPVRRDGSYETTIAWAKGAFNVRAAAPGFSPVNSDRVPLEEGRSEYAVDVQLGEGLSLSGRVVSDLTGEGVADAHVRVTQSGASSSRSQQFVSMGGGLVSSVAGGGGGNGVVVAVTDESGAFRVAGLAQGDFKVSAVAESFVAGSVDARTPFSGSLRLPIAPELEISGTVALGDGKPVASITVTATNADTASKGQAPVSPWGGGGASTTTTDASGGFVLRGLPRGQYVIRVQNTWNGTANVQQFSSQPIAAGTADVRLTVQEGLRIAGHIVNEAGEPVTTCWVWGNPVKPRQGRPSVSVNARAKPDGSFEIVGLPSDAGAYNLTFNAQGMGGTYTPVTLEKVTPGTTGLKVVMKSGLSIEGKIVTADGKPLTNAWLMAQPVRKDGDNTPRSSGNGMLEPDGAFTVAGLQPGTYKLTIQTFGPNGNRQLVIEGGDEVAAGSAGLQLTASAGATITGTVVDDSGRAIPNANVSARPSKGGRNASARTDQNGAFEVSGLEDGATYTLSANAVGKIGSRVEGITAGTTGVRLEMRQGVTAGGTAMAADGTPLAGAWISLRPVDRTVGSAQSTRTDAEGRFTANGLEDGATYRVQARVREGGSMKRHDLGTIEGGQTGMQLQASE